MAYWRALKAAWEVSTVEMDQNRLVKVKEELKINENLDDETKTKLFPPNRPEISKLTATLILLAKVCRERARHKSSAMLH
jgi:hypothetical protein